LRGLGETFGFSQVAENFQAFDLHKDIESENEEPVNIRASIPQA